MRDVRAAASIVFALALSGCVFLVDSLPDDTSTTCHLTTPEFETTGACATCITTNCQTQLNSCCADSSCQGELSNVDQCGAYDCGPLSAATGKNPTIDALVSCIASSCKTTCTEIDAGGVGADDGSTSCSGCKTSCAKNSDDTSCACNAATSSAPGNKISCSTSSVADSVCCASANFPSASGSSCECDVVWCDDSDGYCSCQIGVEVIGGTNQGSCFGGSDGCCLSADRTSCSCDPNDACDGVDETPVDECGPSNMGCAATSSKNESVSSCSVFQ